MKRLGMMSAAILCIAFAGRASGSDQAFGYNTLPILMSDSRFAAEVASAEAASESRRVQMFRLHLKNHVWGESLPVDQLLVFVPKSSGAVTPENFQNTIVFLAGPLKETQLAAWQILSEEPVYQVAGGKGGIVAVSPELRVGMNEYFGIKEPSSPQDFAWSAKYAVSSDPFLQRTAVFKLGRIATQNAALDELRHAATSKKVQLSTRQLAIHFVASAQSEKAFNLLAGIAADTQTDSTIRIAAIYALDHVPQGKEKLEEWTSSSDKILSVNSKLVLQRSSEK